MASEVGREMIYKKGLKRTSINSYDPFIKL